MGRMELIKALRDYPPKRNIRALLRTKQMTEWTTSFVLFALPVWALLWRDWAFSNGAARLAQCRWSVCFASAAKAICCSHSANRQYQCITERYKGTVLCSQQQPTSSQGGGRQQALL